MRFFLMLFLIISCETEQNTKTNVTESTVINGVPVSGNADSELYYSAVSITSKTGLCSGVLVSPSAVLTAAHCIPEDESKHPTHVSLGDPTFGLVKYYHKVKDIIVHPSYTNEKRQYDLAIITLEESAKAPFKPMRIYSEFDFVRPGLPLHVAGYSPFSKGQKKDIYNLLSNDTIKAYQPLNVTIFGNRTLLTRNTIMLDESMPKDRDYFTFAQVTGGICSGDSGGPTMIKLGNRTYLVGINQSVTGTGNKLADCEFLGFSTSVALYKDWIEETITNSVSEAPRFLKPREELNENEAKCAMFLGNNLNFHFYLYKLPKDKCDTYKSEELTKMFSHNNNLCKKTCGDLKGFKDQCEFYARGSDKMLKHVETICTDNP